MSEKEKLQWFEIERQYKGLDETWYSTRYSSENEMGIQDIYKKMIAKNRRDNSSYKYRMVKKILTTEVL